VPETKERDKKLIQYLNEAFGKEKELETALQAHIGMTDRAPYKKRLQAHLRETKAHARKVEQRIKQLGGSPQPVQAVVARATAALKGPVHALRGSGAEEKLLKNAKTEYSEEAEEIATYTAIEAFATSVGDRDTAKLAREIRREEQRMANYLERLIPQLTNAVVRAEVPARERSTSTRRRSPSRRRTTRSRGSSSGRARSTARRSTSSRSRSR
jgi:ferritin-like metal-binding protein YciE